MTVPPQPPQQPGDQPNQTPPQQQGNQANQTPPPPPPFSAPPYQGPGPITNHQGEGNGAATAAMVLGILSFCGILAIPAIILGFIGRNKANQLGGTGRGQATAGIILGFFWLAIGLVLFVVTVILGSLAADEVDRSLREIEDTVERNIEEFEEIGSPIDESKYVISDENVEISDFSIVYTGFITNTSDSTQGYGIDYRCEGDNGEVSSSTTYVTRVQPNDRAGFQAYLSFVGTPSSVECEIVEVTKSF